VLGHSDGSGTAIYNRYGYVKEMRAALEQWVGDLRVDEQPESHFRRAATQGVRGRLTVAERAA
jgi:hypothetical protein